MMNRVVYGTLFSMLEVSNSKSPIKIPKKVPVIPIVRDKLPIRLAENLFFIIHGRRRIRNAIINAKALSKIKFISYNSNLLNLKKFNKTKEQFLFIVFHFKIIFNFFLKN